MNSQDTLVTLPPTAIIIPHYRNKQLTRRCLKSLNENISNPVMVYLIDLSGGLALDEAEENSFPCTIIPSQNLGYGAACNLGIQQAIKGGHTNFLLLNNDTEVGKDFLRPLLEQVVANPNLILGPAIIDGDTQKVEVLAQKLSYSSVKIFPTLLPSDESALDALVEQENNRIPTQIHCGCSILLTKEQFEKLGGFDEGFFLYSEDIDLSLRALKAGYELAVAPASRIYHYHGGSTGGHHSPINIYYNTRNRIAIANHHFSLFHQILFYLTFPLLQLFKLVIWGVSGRMSLARVLGKSLVAGVRGERGIKESISGLQEESRGE